MPVFGRELTVPTLDGCVTVSVQAGTLLRLRGQGLPVFGGGACGDLFLRIQVHVPEKLSTEEKTIYDRLRALGKGL